MHRIRHRSAPRLVAIAAAMATAAGTVNAVPVSWTQTSSGFWDTAGNWSIGVVPGAADDVALALTGTRVITYRQDVRAINSLAVGGGNTLTFTGGTLSTVTLANTSLINVNGGTFNVGSGSSGSMAIGSGGTLGITGTLNATGPISLQGGRIVGGTVQQSGANGLYFGNYIGNRLDGVTVRGALNIVASRDDRVLVSNGLTVLSEDGTAPGVINVGTTNTLGSGAILGFTSTQSFDNATINLGNPSPQGYGGRISLDVAGAFTLGANAVVQGNGTIGPAVFIGGTTTNLVNAGTISADQRGRTLTIGNSGTLRNTGTLQAINGGVLSINPSGSWSNTGTIRVADASSTVNLDGSFTSAALGSFDNVAGGNLNLTGKLDNTGATLAFSAASGSIRLRSAGQITGGTVQQSGANGLRISDFNGTLDGVTVRGALDVGDTANKNARVRIINGLTVLSEDGTAPGVINVGTVAGVTSAIIDFSRTQSFDNATINLGNASQNGGVSLSDGGTLTLAANAVVQGSGNLGAPSIVGVTPNNIVNAGTVSANQSGRTLTISNNGTFTNNGTLAVAAGATLEYTRGALASSGVVSGSGTLRTGVANALVNTGIVTPGTSAAPIGTLTLDGDLTMGGSGALRFDLADKASFDRLAVTDDVLFAGTIHVVNLGYVPVLGDRFTLVTFDQRLADSAFADVTTVGYGPEVSFSVSYNPSDVTLTVTAVPEPAASAMWLAGLVGLGAVVSRHRRRSQAAS